MLSVAERDRLEGIRVLDEESLPRICRGLESIGFTATQARPARKGDLASANSSWSKRLRVGSGRDAWLIEFHRRPSV